MKKIAVIGHFGFGKNLLNGQTVKTKTITEGLRLKFGEEQVLTIDTHGGKFHSLKVILKLVSILRKSDNIMIMLAHNGLRVLVPILSFLNVFYRKKLHYVVIGGWLSDYLLKRKHLKKHLQKFKAIYVETNTLKNKLENQNFDNIFVVPNSKKLHIINESDFTLFSSEPYKLCTFSRVMKEKGIEDIVKIVKSINEDFKREIYTLDIYGQIDVNQIKWFQGLKNNFPPYINYKGEIPYDQSVEVLKNYFLLVFPSNFYTEGVPGTIIDAYSAGVPVISSMWESFTDVVDNGVTGFGYGFNDLEALRNLLLDIMDNPNKINKLKVNCIAKAKNFDLENTINKFKI